MPYVFRDANGKVCRATVRPIHGAESLPHGHPELVEFLRERGQDPDQIEQSLGDLRKTDAEMSRAVEDVIMALLKKNILKMTDLPKPVQDRMASRVKLRVMIQDAYDQASGQTVATISGVPSTGTGIES